jgi:hypothetical protein
MKIYLTSILIIAKGTTVIYFFNEDFIPQNSLNYRYIVHFILLKFDVTIDVAEIILLHCIALHCIDSL